MVHYREEPLAWQTLDMIVDQKLVVETKATERLHPGASMQLFGYLCATNRAQRPAGCCCVRQCSVPRPHTRSTA